MSNNRCTKQPVREQLSLISEVMVLSGISGRFKLILKHEPAQETHIYIADILSPSRTGSLYVPRGAMTSYIFIVGVPRWKTKPSVIHHLLICPPSAAYWSLIKRTTFLLCQQHRVLTLSVEYIMPKTCQIRWRSLQRIIETYHTHRISAKPPVLKIFIRIHFLMELESGNHCRLAQGFTALAWISQKQRLLLCLTPQYVPSRADISP